MTWLRPQASDLDTLRGCDRMSRCKWVSPHSIGSTPFRGPLDESAPTPIVNLDNQHLLGTERLTFRRRSTSLGKLREGTLARAQVPHWATGATTKLTSSRQTPIRTYRGIFSPLLSAARQAGRLQLLMTIEPQHLASGLPREDRKNQKKSLTDACLPQQAQSTIEALSRLTCSANTSGIGRSRARRRPLPRNCEERHWNSSERRKKS
jgi:hypothetical protein